MSYDPEKVKEGARQVATTLVRVANMIAATGVPPVVMVMAAEYLREHVVVASGDVVTPANVDTFRAHGAAMYRGDSKAFVGGEQAATEDLARALRGGAPAPSTPASKPDVPPDPAQLSAETAAELEARVKAMLDRIAKDGEPEGGGGS